jgi:hypothetical protein
VALKNVPQIDVATGRDLFFQFGFKLAAIFLGGYGHSMNENLALDT